LAYPILGTPSPAFFDSSGSPLASGTITTLDPADGSTVKASYPTADDADASTNGTSGDITLDASGRPTSTQYWGRDNEDYKVVIKDSSGSTILTMDDIRVPAHTRRAAVTFPDSDATPTIAESSFFITADGTTITDLDDGQVGDEVTIQAGSTTMSVQDNAALVLDGNHNFRMYAGDTIAFKMFTDQVWTETGRSQVAGNVEITTLTSVVIADENGRTFYLNSASEFAVTLPVPALGLNYEFIVSGAPSGANYTVGSDSGDNVMHVFILDIVGELTYAASQDVVTFVDGGVVGDRLKVRSDGTSWFCEGLCGVDGKMTSGAT